MKNLLLYIACMISLQSTGQKIIRKPIPDKLVVLTFDDAPVTHFTNVAPLLKQYGFGATFFVCEFPPNFSDTSKYMTWKQMQQLGKMGFEVANHTHTHAHVDRLSKEGVIAQLKYIEDKCDSLKLGRPHTFAYPGYGLDAKTLDVLKERHYSFARAGGSRPYDPLSDHPYLIPSWATNEKNKTEIMNALQQAKDGKIVVLTIHGVPDYEHPWVTTPPELFKEYLQFLHDNQYTVISLKDLDKYVNVKQALKQIKPDIQKPLKN
ncbi:polysaccharide deacetylase family protein [Chitinophagaceae bacterium LB-8]|uniref:Polysaccharide deacetylase family protein n=1 Tax=Paraflavisolibacter caeni TaxID=2982496 RepID=A0A9X3B9F9_9BACT|nr:polysaccharide deacetylase family protein [Paraflavisolibacter caeni]MCU7551211.1 polysaccharide deacetylase family protein [Paraflavisolibacter caeni]